MKNRRRRPEVEELETMTLLSSIAGEAHAPALAAPVATAPLPNPLPLTGSLHGSVHSAGLLANIANGSGAFAGIGHVTFRMNEGFPLVGGPADFGDIKFSTKKLGSFSIQFDGEDFPINSYEIDGGTNAFQHETGSGTLTFGPGGRGNKITLIFS